MDNHAHASHSLSKVGLRGAQKLSGISEIRAASDSERALGNVEPSRDSEWFPIQGSGTRRGSGSVLFGENHLKFAF